MRTFIQTVGSMTRIRVLHLLLAKYGKNTKAIEDVKASLKGMEASLMENALKIPEQFGVSKIETEHKTQIIASIDAVIEVALLKLSEGGYSKLLKYLNSGSIPHGGLIVCTDSIRLWI